MTTIRYFVPEDGDTEDHPNIFLLPKTQNSGFSPRLREVKQNFPMPGTYHFRFKSPLIPGSDREKNAVSVWMDCVDDDQHVGVWRNTIVAKVTRINMDDDDDDDEDFARHRNANGSSHQVHTAPASSPAPPRRAPSQQASPRQSSRPAPPAPAPTPASPPNLLGFDDPVSAAPASNGSLLDDNTGMNKDDSLLNLNDTSGYNTNLQHQSSHDDFLGMTSTPIATAVPAPTPPPASAGSAPSSYGMPGMPQQQQQQRTNSGNGHAAKPGKAFDTFTNQSGPFGGLKW